jgi:hypothetical protein
VVDLVGNFEDIDDDERLRLAVRLSLEAARPSAPQLDYTTSAPEQELTNVPTSLDGWEEDNDSLFRLHDSHFQAGTRAFPVIPAGPLPYTRALQSTPRRKPTPKPSDKTFAAPPFSVTENRSSPSSHVAAMSLPYIVASRRGANMPAVGNSPVFPPALTNKTSTLPSHHDESSIQFETESTPTEMSELRAARLRHFESQTRKASIDTAPSVLAPTTTPNFEAAPKVNPIARDIMGKKVAETEYIDLTSD